MPANTERPYRGRFAPSPSGPLHFGSLIAALASYLDAKHHQGKWLVRIEDIDPPREQPGADTLILKTLEAYGLYWDEAVLYQSQQTSYYLEQLNDLAEQHQSYFCHCTRAQIKAMGGIYNGNCKPLNLTANNAAIRLANTAKVARFTDLIQGEVRVDENFAAEDFILRRRDGLFAYQLAVVLDDVAQNISHVVRGSDLLWPTVRQCTLYQQLNQAVPQFAHFPVAATKTGFKLSKQNKAPALDVHQPQQTLLNALAFLNQTIAPEMATASVEQILQFAINHWQRERISQQTEILI